MVPQKATKVKNKSAAPVQITAEQILRVALENQSALPKAPKQNITDKEELGEYRTRKRKQYEEILIRLRLVSVWMKYAHWEETQLEFDRARSIYERALDENYKNVTVWLKYAEMEMRSKNINHARNVWDRAVSLLPRISQLWYKYCFMEDMMGNTPAARTIFERWMTWKPEEQAWNAYIKFEVRLGLSENARSTWIKYAKFEEKIGNIENARSVYSRAVEFLGEEGSDETLFISFAKFEERFKEVERARLIYKYALDHIPKHKAQSLFEMFTNFEKQHGDRVGIEDVILGKRRFQYEEDIKKNPKNYDVWFDYTRLEENNGEVEKARDVYERAIANIPPMFEKKYWRRYIYLWINYALFEEDIAKDTDKAREVFMAVIKLVPHRSFSFSKIWILYANFEIRQLQLDAARKILGQAIGLAPKSKIFDAYIHLEIELGNFDRVRKLYEKYIEIAPDHCDAWCKFAQLETELGESKRARGIYEIAIQQPSLDTPEVVWKNYIATIDNFEAARATFNEAHKALVGSDKEERLMLLEAWKHFESKFGTPEQVELVMKKVPKRIIRRKIIKAPDGTDAGIEEYFEYIFPEEQSAQPNLKFLENALKWKKQKVGEEK
eukprot:gene15626-18566_t